MYVCPMHINLIHEMHEAEGIIEWTSVHDWYSSLVAEGGFYLKPCNVR